MNIASRAKNILFRPRSEWPVAAAEPASTGSLMTYAAILAAIAQICGLIGTWILVSAAASMTPGMPVMTLTDLAMQGVVSYVIALGIIYLMSLIAASLAGRFGGQGDKLQALKLLVYAGTAVWIGGMFAIIPILGWFVMLVGYAYAIYLIFLGAPITMGVPEGKNGGYTAAVVVIWLIITIAATLLLAHFMPVAGMGGSAPGSPASF